MAPSIDSIPLLSYLHHFHHTHCLTLMAISSPCYSVSLLCAIRQAKWHVYPCIQFCIRFTDDALKRCIIFFYCYCYLCYFVVITMLNYFQIGSYYVAWICLELVVQTQLAFNSRSFCHSFLRAETTNVFHQAWLAKLF